MPVVDAADHEDVWVKVISLARAIDSRSYYQLLGVNMDASGEELRQAFHKSAAVLRSLRRRAEALPERKHAVETLIGRLHEAHQVLADMALRRRYDEGLESGVVRMRAGSESEALRPAPPPERMRADSRHPFEAMVRVRCPNWADFLTLHANNISSGGLFVKTATPLQKGMAVRLRIVLPQQYTLELEAEVVRVVQGPTPGMGLAFRPMDDFRKSIVEHLVSEARAAEVPHPPRRFAAATNAPPSAPEPIEDEETTPYDVGGTPKPSASLHDEDLFSRRPAEQALSDAIDSLSADESAAEARAALAAGHFADACVKFSDAIRANKRDLSLRAGFHLACAYEAKRIGRLDEAHEHFERVLIFDKTCREAIRELRS